MRPAISENPQSLSPPIISPVKPLVYNFFLGHKPTAHSLQCLDLDTTCYRGFSSRKFDPKIHCFFKPTLQSKKLVDQPKFLLSVQRKKVKIINGIRKKANSQQPIRNSYRGSKLKSHSKQATIQQETPQHPPTNYKTIQPQEQYITKSPRKAKQPNLHFNLRHLLKTRKQFNLQYSQAENIQGSSFPYYSYFSSQKSSFPQTSRNNQEKCPKTANSQKRYISTTMEARARPTLYDFQKWL